MPKPLTIHLVRHGESEANLDKTVNERVADHRVALSEAGRRQAVDAGMLLAGSLDQAGAARGAIKAYCSPYLRTRETWSGLKTGLVTQAGVTSEKADGYAGLTAVESIHLRELEYGLFDGIPDDRLADEFPREFKHYEKQMRYEGEFYARMPCGESRCDVAQRVHQFFGTLLRDHERHGVGTAIIVSHGVTLRAFAMMWLNLPVEWMEAERNPRNCSIRTIVDGAWHPETEDGYVHSGYKPARPTKQSKREAGSVQ